MNHRVAAVGLTLLGFILIGARASCAEVAKSPLATYIAKPDASYSWVKRREGKLGTGTYTELTLTSQTWKDIVWKHSLFLFKPADVVEQSQVLLMIAGGRWKEELAGPADAAKDSLPKEAVVLAAAASAMKSPVAVLLHVPQQPIFGNMVEDEAISYTFEEYLKSNDAEWPLLLPMTKSAVRAMDAIQEFAKQDWKYDVKGFTLTGASKRGWTTWLTAGQDPRVNVFVPMVIDVLNMEPQMKHQMATWGKFSEQIEDYTRRGIQQKSGTTEGKALNAIVDPYSYVENYKQPKLVMLGTNDRYWPLDALNIYWNDLPGEKYVLYIPNNGHGLNDIPRITGALSAMNKRATGRLTMPKLSWQLEPGKEGLSLLVKSDQLPQKVVAWLATAPTKDFREAKWSSQPATLKDGVYSYQLKMPESGYAAMFGEAVYQDAGTPYFLSTNVKIIGK